MWALEIEHQAKQNPPFSEKKKTTSKQMNIWSERVIDATDIITSRKGVGTIRERGYYLK